MKQINLFRTKMKNEFGGRLLKGKRKSARPLGFKSSNHLVLKAKNSFLLLQNKRLVSEVLHRYGKKFGVQILSHAVQSDHVHISFQTHNREAYRKWIRAVTSILVAKISGLKFIFRPWSRIVAWGRAYQAVKAYIASNEREAVSIYEGLEVINRFEARFKTFGLKV